ncbi:MBL fold metallo-hydrolase, partial [bacterium]|nr:MBL fold metallo-hydrolase [bacterium]
MKESKDVTIVPTKQGLFSKEWLIVLIVVLLAASAWTIAWKQTDSATAEKMVYRVEERIKELRVTFLDVGQGDSSFILTPGGHSILIDAGPGQGMYSNYDAGKQAVIPFLRKIGITKIDTLVMTHPHADHYGGMHSLLESGIEIGEYLDPGMDHPSRSYRKLLATIGKQEIPYKEIHAPLVLNWDPEIFVQVLWPEKGYFTKNPNNASIVLRLVYGDVVYNFSGDAEDEIEGRLNAYGPAMRTTVLKVPHHGSKTSSTRTFMENITPRLAIFSVGVNNRFNHPNKDILDLYDKL